MDASRNSRFLWGTATSAFQIEGHIKNDMTEWEHQGGFRRDGLNPVSGVTCDHWNRWRKDFRLLRDLGVNSYRLSIEWARIEPVRNHVDLSAVNQYREMIDTLVDYGITPMVTLHHFTHPRWFHVSTPWHTPESIAAFSQYVDIVARELLAKVPLVVTINEPLVWLLAAYADGKFPPGERNLNRMMTALHNMLLAHRRAYDRIKYYHPDTQVGLAHNFIIFKRARSTSAIDRQLKELIHYFYNLMIVETFQTNRLHFSFPLMVTYDSPIELDDRIDFWGINYYYRLHVRFRLDLRQPFELLALPRSGHGQSDLGWEIYPKGLQKICDWLSGTNKPLYITENGVAAVDDQLRLRFLESHLAMLEKLLDEGYPLRGYYYWSLLDNYEWLVGTKARFGLIEVDFERNLKRSVKPSGEFYRTYISEARRAIGAKSS